MLKRNANGTYVIKTKKQAELAAQMLEDRTQEISDIETAMEEEFGFQTVRAEAIALQQSIKEYMVSSGTDKLDMKKFRWQVVRGSRKSWNSDKLRTILGKARYLKVCDVTPSPEKIDNLVREGKIDIRDIDPALDIEPNAPYIKRYENSDAKGKEEADRVKAAMS
jgi:hypothetical protein